MIELYVLRQFAAFAEAGTLSEAAEVLHLSQPALSRNMKKLEEDLGVILFERKKNKLELNQNGFYVLDLTRKTQTPWQKRHRILIGKTGRFDWGSVPLHFFGLSHHLFLRYIRTCPCRQN